MLARGIYERNNFSAVSASGWTFSIYVSPNNNLPASREALRKGEVIVVPS
jgi:hypothetical protein